MAAHSMTSNVMVSGPGGVELNQQLDDHFKKSIEHIHNSSPAAAGSPGTGSGGLLISLTSSGATWRDKQTRLPRSFFEPAPNSGRSQNHSRDNSTDSSGRYTQSPPISVVGIGVSHNRAHSSPAMLTPAQLSLPQSIASGKRQSGNFATGMRHISSAGFGAGSGLPPLAAAPHQRFASYDSAAAAAAAATVTSTAGGADFDDLPEGWERAFNADTGQYVYLNYAEKRTSLDDPRKCMSASHLHHHSLVQQQNMQPQPMLQPQPLAPLPPGWEESYTNDGHKYFINHNEQTTTWYDPRLPEEMQRPTILQQRQMQQQLKMPNKLEGTFMGQPMHQMSASAPSHCFNAMNNNSRQQMMMNSNGMKISGAHCATFPSNSAVGTFSPNSQKRVQDLNKECASYRLRQEEIMRQGLLMDNSLSPNPMSPTQNLAMEPCVPYVGTSSSLMGGAETHLRQESSDSGVGLGSGAVYGSGMTTGCSGYSSQPLTPDTFLIGSSPRLQRHDLPSLNIAGIDLNFDVNLPMEVDATEDIPQLNPNDLDQILNCRSSIRH